MNVRDLIGKDIEFVKGIEDLDGYAECGMRAVVTNVHKIDDDVWRIDFDFTDYDMYNRQFESAYYYDRAGSPVLTARAANMYSVVDHYYFDSNFDHFPLSNFFKVVNASDKNDPSYKLYAAIDLLVRVEKFLNEEGYGTMTPIVVDVKKFLATGRKTSC